MTVRIINKPSNIENEIKLRDESLWCWHGEIPSETCDKIIKSADDNWDNAKIGIGGRTNGKYDKETRSTDVHFANDEWIYNLLEPYMIQANKNAGWNYDISGIESYQIGRYTAKDSGHYDWHQDGLGGWKNIYNKPLNVHLHNKTRKLSMSLILNDPSEYEGGQLEIWGNKVGVYKKGSIIFFPSWMLHRVTPVTKGTRYSLVMWFLGAPFK